MPADDELQVQVKVALPPPTMVCGGAGATELQLEPAGGVTFGATEETMALAPLAPAVLESVSVTVVTWLVSTVAGLAEKAVAASTAGACPITAAVVLLTGPRAAPELASVPLTVAPKASVPVAATVHDQVNARLLPPPTSWEAGLADPQVAAPPGFTVGATEVTCDPACPVSFTVRVMDTGWPVSAVERLAAALAVRAAAVCTVRVAWGLALAPRGARLVASVPLTLAPSAMVPAADGVQVQVNVPLPPPPIVAVGGLAAVQVAATPAAEGATEVTFAAAAPVLLTVRVSDNTWPVLAVVTPPPTAMVAASDAGLCAVTLAGVAVALTVAPEFASVPLTVAPSARDPVVEGVQVQVNVPDEPPAMDWLAGLAGVQVALAVPVLVGVAAVAFAAAWPVLFTVRVKVTA
ncbi:MAG TPA: hypothetical protein VKP11_09305 [Frankiaceae bacterium]|nr:hypothetical protein [Frankiaceae bacterium]